MSMHQSSWFPSKVAVIGSGQMGAGIAQVMSTYGFQTVLFDSQEQSLEKGLKGIEVSCDRLIKKAQLTEDHKRSILEKIKGTTTYAHLEGCEFVVEAVPENLEIKRKVFTKLSEILDASAIVCSNTSSISITLLASFTRVPENFMGMHFMNPVPIMKLVEGIRGLQTSDQTFSRVAAITERMEKVLVESKDMPGFMVNRILMPMINEAAFVLQEGIGRAEDIDSAMKLGTNQPMGPLTLADFIGLDTCLAIMKVLHEQLGDSKYRPSPLLAKYVEAGWLGKKSGRGFYNYNEAKK